MRKTGAGGGYPAPVARAAFLLLLLLADAALAARPVPVVLVHGFASRSDIWDGLVPLLRARGFDPRPVDWSPGPGMDALACAREQVRPALVAAAGEGSGPLAVVGHSMGGLLLRRLLLDDPALGERVRHGVTISTPHQGTRTGIDAVACHSFRDRLWRPLACELNPRNAMMRALGGRVQAGEATRWVAIGVESPAPFFLLPVWDGDGDGRPHGHDNAVMAEAARLDGAPFLLFSGSRMASHFRVTCASPVAESVVRALEGRGDLAEALLERPARDLCRPERDAGRGWEARRNAGGEGRPEEPGLR
jgi:pimeloyl-ACP methyl ester carboxylesterase